MKPGDLVRVTGPCNSLLKNYVGGEIGVIIGWGATHSGVVRNDLYRVLFPEGIETFALHFLEPIDDGASETHCVTLQNKQKNT